MASLSCDANGNRTIQFFDGNGRRRTIRLGSRTEKDAEKIQAKVESLNADAISGQAWSTETAKWVKRQETTLYDKLAAVGLVPPRVISRQATLAEFVDSYIEGRSDVKWSTGILYRNVRRNLVDFFGTDRQLNAITSGDADDWRRWLAREKKQDDATAGGEGLGRETVRQRCRLAKQFFRDAVRRKLLDDNPFAEMKGVSARGNRERDYFVSRAEASKVLEACPDAEWRLLFALSRYGGLRCPSEHLLLRWQDVNWERGRIVVHSPKTEHHDGKATRVLPLFPELRPYLEAVWDAAPEGAEFVIERWRLAEVNLRTRLHAIIRAAGMEPWPKSFQQLRSTRQTELEEQYPTHVVCAWLGNSPRVAARHYLQVTDDHFDQATEKNAARALHPTAVSSVSGRTGPQRDSKFPGNCNAVRNETSKSGRGRTRICDLLHVKQAL
jgi:integrase